MRRWILLVSIWLLFSPAVFAQFEKVDSISARLATAPKDTAKVNRLNEVVALLRDKDNNRAYALAQQAVDLADSLNYNIGHGIALEHLGWILYRRGDFSKSLEISTKALKLSEESNDRNALSRALISIAAIHYEQKQYAQAIAMMRRAGNTAKAIGDQQTLARCYNNIAYSHLALKQLDSALINAEHAIRIAQAAGEDYLYAFAKRIIGDIYLERKDVPNALDNYFECLEIASRVNNNFIRASTLHRIGMSYSSINKHDLALGYLLEDVRVAKKFGFKDELERAYKNISETYIKKGDALNAYSYLNQYMEIHDSLHNQRRTEQIAMMQAKYDSDIKEAQIALLTKEAALRAGEMQNQRLWTYFFAGSLILFVFIGAILLYSNRQTSRAKLALEAKNIEIEKQAQQLREVNSAKDKLFSIISHDLRSPVASLRGLMDIVSKSGLTQEEFVHVAGTLKDNLDSVYEDLDNLLLWAQTQLKGMQASPEEVMVWKLVQEKINLFREPAESKNITITNEISQDANVYVDRNHLAIILRNLIANAIKFNRAGGTIRLFSAQKGSRWEISVSDSGVGLSGDDVKRLFNAETHFSRPGTNREKGVGLGLMLTKEFIERNNGNIWVTSELGHGSTFTFSLRTGKVPVLA